VGKSSGKKKKKGKVLTPSRFQTICEEGKRGKRMKRMFFLFYFLVRRDGGRKEGDFCAEVFENL